MFEPDLSKPDIDRQGLCHQKEYEAFWHLFFADTALERRPARNLCADCPVREACLRWALEKGEIWGIWGGCDEAELRRALWVDANGEPTNRCRFPHCPACHARPSKLVIVGVCEIKTTRKRERVECIACGFTWRAATSVAAVKAYWRDRNRRIRARSAASSRRIPAGTARIMRPVVPSDPPEIGVQVALVASGARLIQ